MAPERRAWVVVGGIAAYAASSALLFAVAEPMRAGGTDILPFEFAGTVERVDEIIVGWGAEGVRAARLQTALDFGYLAIYSTALAATLAHVTAWAAHPLVRRAGAVLGWAAFLAAGFDVVENVALLFELSGSRGVLPRLAWACAGIKFALVLSGLAFALVGLAAGLVRWVAARVGGG